MCIITPRGDYFKNRVAVVDKTVSSRKEEEKRRKVLKRQRLQNGG